MWAYINPVEYVFHVEILLRDYFEDCSNTTLSFASINKNKISAVRETLQCNLRR